MSEIEKERERASERERDLDFDDGDVDCTLQRPERKIGQVSTRPVMTWT